MNNVKSLLNMLCALDLRRIFVPQAKTVLLVKQRHFHLFTDLTNMSYSLLKRIWHKCIWWVVVSSRVIIQKSTQSGCFLAILSQKVWFNDDESASSWANTKRQVYPPSLVTVQLCLWKARLSKGSVDTSWCTVWLGFKRFCCLLPHQFSELSTLLLLCRAIENLRDFKSFTL